MGDAATVNFSFALCGRAYAADDPTQLDDAASTHVTYTHGTTYLNGTTVAAGATGILDDSSLMVDNTSADSSYLRLDIGWLLDFCPDDFRIEYSDGTVSFVQKGNYLYLYFPNGIGGDLYADPGYFSIGVTLGETIEEIRIPGSDGYYVPGTDDWVFPIHVVEDDGGYVRRDQHLRRYPGPQGLEYRRAAPPPMRPSSCITPKMARSIRSPVCFRGITPPLLLRSEPA